MSDTNIISRLTCDRCQKEYNGDLEIQEFLKIHLVGGFGSVFGDGNEITAAICQYCAKEILESVNYQVKELW